MTEQLEHQIERREPGIYIALPDYQYHMDMAVSSTGGRKLNDNAARYWINSVLNPEYDPRPKGDKNKRARFMGIALHKALFEPEFFNDQYYVIGEQPWQMGKLSMSKSEKRRIDHCVSEILSHPNMNGLVHGGWSEVSIFFDVDGVRCRIRPDSMKIIRSTLYMMDYKKTRSVRWEDMRWTVIRDGWDVQAAFYRMGMIDLIGKFRRGEITVNDIHTHYDTTLEQREEIFKDWSRLALVDNIEWINLAQEEHPPYVFEPYRMTEPVLENARPEIDKALSIYRENLTRHGFNRWPANTGKIKDMFVEDLPPRRY